MCYSAYKVLNRARVCYTCADDIDNAEIKQKFFADGNSRNGGGSGVSAKQNVQIKIYG